MTSDVTTHGYRLHALIPDNPPVGLDIILSASRTVRLNGFSQEVLYHCSLLFTTVQCLYVERSQSAFRAVGMNKYQVSVSGYPYNAMTGKKIAVYFRREEGEEEWVFSFIERQNGYM